MNSEQLYGFSVGPQFGCIYAQAIELVYPVETKSKYLSELLWDMKPLLYAGLQVDFGLNDIMSRAGFFSDLSFKAGFPGETGIHENRDWMSVENANLTHYSKHTNKTKEFFMIDWQNGVSIPLSFLYIKPFINFSWMRFSFSGTDGYGEYARGKIYDSNNNPIEYPASWFPPTMFFPITDNPRKETFVGEVITYEQNWFLFAPGFTLGTNILSPFFFDISFQISPLSFCEAVDHHLTRDIVFYDSTRFGLFLESSGNVTFNWKFIELTIDFTYRYIGDTIGITYMNDSKRPVSNKSGAGLNMIDAGFLIKIQYYTGL